MSVTKFRVRDEWIPIRQSSTVLPESVYAWASWDGASMSVYDSYNVDQLLDEGLGKYSIEFPDAGGSNFAVVGGCEQKTTTTNTNANTVPFVSASSITSKSAGVECFFPGNSSYKADPNKVSLVVFS